ncbi:MAG: hypothetical protein MI750_07405 [Xanthomonadales bacterium]|jgi:hypothetical protein|nr:hypothetical protein [Xanthomonadales bacterium]
MTAANVDTHFALMLDAESLGRLFMPNAGSFEVIAEPAIQDEYIVDSLDVASPLGKCRLVFSEWEENNAEDEKWWVTEYAVELTIGERIAYGTYRFSYSLDQGDTGVILDRLREDAENDFMLCCKLIGRSVRRDLVVDDDLVDTNDTTQQLH